MIFNIVKLWFKVRFGTFEYLKPIKEENHITKDNRWYNNTIDYQLLKGML